MAAKTKPWEEVRAKLPGTAKFQAIVELERQQALAEIVEYQFVLAEIASALREYLKGLG